MQVEMRCPHCCRASVVHLETADDDFLHQVFDGGPVYALGDGETFEDMISTALTEHDPVHCPTCDTVLQYSEESLGRLAMSMLVRM